MIDLLMERPGGNSVRAVGPEGILIGETRHTQSLILTPEQVMLGWPPQAFGELEITHLDTLFGLQPEVALLGTGKQHLMLSRALQIEVYQRGVALEIMSTDAACRTFNILAADGRRVAAALLPMR